MGDHYGYGSKYPRPRSPTLYNPARASLPTNVGYSGYIGGYGDPMYPTPRRDIPPHPRSSGERLTMTGPTTTTKYKVIPASTDNNRSSSLRAGSRSRSATIDSSGRPLATSHAPRLRPVIHTGLGRPSSPISNPYRASDDGAYLVPASSHHRHSGHHRGVHSIDNSAEYRSKNRDVDYLRSGSGREGTTYTSSRSRPSYSNALVTASDDYTDPGYSFTSSRDLGRYDVDPNTRTSRNRRDSSESRSRPASVIGIADLGAKSFDGRERGPPPTTRGRDKLPTTRATLDVPVRSRADLGYESDSRSRKARPVSMYEERDLPRSQRDSSHTIRETEVRDRAPREKSHHHSRHDDDDRPRNSEKHSERKDHKSRESLAATIGLAAASALGLGAAAQNRGSERDDRDEPSRTRDDSDEEPRRRRRAEEKGYTREGGRESPPRERDFYSTRDGEYKRREPKDRHDSLSSQSPPREKRSSPPIPNDSRARHETVTAMDHPKEEKSKNRSRSDSGSTHSSDFSSGERDRRPRREQERIRGEPSTPTTPSTAFNPKNTMDLRALKEQLNRQDEPREAKRQSIASMAVGGAALAASASSRDRNYDLRADGRGRRDLIDETQPPKELREPQHQIRVVSPPRETQIAKVEEKPVKGILRAPREKFPEDPTHIREGVAPLKDAKKDGVPPNARWTRISRTLVNPAALEAGKERFEEDDEFVTVLRVLSKEEIQQYATITESIRYGTAAREEEEKERQKQRRRERHERHKRERADHPERHRSSRRRKEEESESDTTEEDDRDNDHVRAIEAPDAPRPRRIAFEDHPLMSGGLGDLKENPKAPGTFTGYTRNPPPPPSSGR